MRARLTFFFATLVLAACGATSATPSEPGSAVGADAGTDSEAAPPDAGGDGADAGATGDASADAASSTLDVEVNVDTLFQNCMPIVPSDPVTVQGSVKVTNNGTSPVGPLTFANGRFLDGKLASLASFAVDTTTQVLAPGAKATVLFEKTASSLTPANGCQTLACNSEVTVELSFAGPGVPAGAHARSKPETVSCAF